MTQVLFLALLFFALTASAAGDADALRAAHSSLKDALASSPFGSPVLLVSRERPENVSGDIHAVLGQPFSAALSSLDKPAAWCDILFLHLNTKYCRPTVDRSPARLDVALGRKHDQPLEDTYRMTLDFRVVERTKDYLRVEMRAESGPFSTRDYRIVFEAVPLPNQETFIHLTYTYGYGLSSKLATQAYLGTLGSHKVGFTVEGKDADGKPKYVGGMRGVVERNTMRYYLAIDSYLGALGVPPQSRMERSLRDWFTATERFPRQLHEIGQAEYLDMKRREYQRIQS